MNITKYLRFFLIVPLILIMLTSCQAIKPKKVDTSKKEKEPVKKVAAK